MQIPHNHHQYSIILDERGKHSYSIYLEAGLLVDAMMIALFACRRLEQNGNGGANADNNKSLPKSLIASDYSGIQYYELDPPKNWARSNHYSDSIIL